MKLLKKILIILLFMSLITLIGCGCEEDRMREADEERDRLREAEEAAATTSTTSSTTDSAKSGDIAFSLENGKAEVIGDPSTIDRENLQVFESLSITCSADGTIKADETIPIDFKLENGQVFTGTYRFIMDGTYSKDSFNGIFGASFEINGVHDLGEPPEGVTMKGPRVIHQYTKGTWTGKFSLWEAASDGTKFVVMFDGQDKREGWMENYSGEKEDTSREYNRLRKVTYKGLYYK